MKKILIFLAIFSTLLATAQDRPVYGPGKVITRGDSVVHNARQRFATAPLITNGTKVYGVDPTTGYLSTISTSLLGGSGSGTVKIIQYITASRDTSFFRHDSLAGVSVRVTRSGLDLYPGVDYTKSNDTIRFLTKVSIGEPVRIQYGSFNVITDTVPVPPSTPPAVLRDLVLETRSAGLNASGTSPRNYDGGSSCSSYDNYGTSDSALSAGTDGRIQWQGIGSNSDNCVVGLKLSHTNERYRTGSVNNMNVAAMRLGTTLYVLDGTADLATIAGTYSGDMYFAIFRTGSVYTLQTSPDGTNWTPRYTYTFFSSTAKVYGAISIPCYTPISNLKSYNFH